MKIAIKTYRRTYGWAVWNQGVLVGVNMLPRFSEKSARRRAEQYARRTAKVRTYKREEYPYNPEKEQS